MGLDEYIVGLNLGPHSSHDKKHLYSRSYIMLSASVFCIDLEAKRKVIFNLFRYQLLSSEHSLKNSASGSTSFIVQFNRILVDFGAAAVSASPGSLPVRNRPAGPTSLGFPPPPAPPVRHTTSTGFSYLGG